MRNVGSFQNSGKVGKLSGSASGSTLLCGAYKSKAVDDLIIVNITALLKMTQLDVVTSLPTCVSCNILRDWLSLKDVVALDSAYCCKVNRTFFIDLLQSDEYFVREKTVYPQNYAKVNALPKLGGKMRCMYFEDNITHTQAHFAAQYCHHLTHVYLDGPWCSPTVLYDIMNVNKGIENLSINIDDIRLGPGEHMLSFAGISLPKLKSLALTGFGFEHNYISAALPMSNCIVRLNLRRAKLRKCTLVKVQRLCPNLISLGLGYTRIDGRWSDDALNELTAACPHIVHLDIDNALNCFDEETGITDAGILAVVQNLKGLRSLSIMSNRNLTYASSVHVYTHCANTLQKLRLDCNSSMKRYNMNGVSAFNTLFERCTRLRYLYFSDWYEGTAHDVGITLPAATLRNLTTLILIGNVVCERILVNIRNYGNNLQHLALFNRKIDNVCPSLLEGCPKLVGLYIDPIYPSHRSTIDLSVYKRDGLIVGSTLPEHLLGFNVLDI